MTLIIEVNCETNEQIKREASAQEVARLNELQAQFDAEKQAKAEAQAKREAAVAKLQALGLDEDDLKALRL